MPVKVSYNIDLSPDLPNEVMDVARKQGEDPDRVCADIQELRDMIFGNIIHQSFYAFCPLFTSFIDLFTQSEDFVCHPVRTTSF